MLENLLSSLRNRLIFIFALLFSLLVGAISYVELHDSQTSGDIPGRIEQAQRFQANFAAIKQNAQRLEGLVYQYSVLQEDYLRNEIERLAMQLGIDYRRLQAQPYLNQHASLKNRVDEQMQLVQGMEANVQLFLELMKSADYRFPSAPILKNQLQPLNVEFTQTLLIAISDLELYASEAGSGNYQNASNTLYNIRYYWMQHISTVRAFIANRMGIFDNPISNMKQNIKDRQLYLKVVYENIDKLEYYIKRGNIDFQQGQLPAKLRGIATSYDRIATGIESIYLSDEWRADYPYLKHQLQPMFNKLQSNIQRTDEELVHHNKSTQLNLFGTTQNYSNIIVFIAIGFILIMIAAYLSFEMLMRRPVQQVTKAMEAEAKGDDYELTISGDFEESRSLLNAFKTLKNQLTQRQKRLESILESAGDAIITIDDGMRITSFNKSAEELFGYNSKSILDQPVDLLFSTSCYRQCTEMLRDYLYNNKEEGTFLPQIDARRADESEFYGSIRLNLMEIEGRKFVTAVISDISENVAIMKHLRMMAEHDSLTGLFNRHYIINKIEEIVNEEVSGEGFSSALLYIDLDNFKYANDTLGHLAGDEILKSVSRQLKKRVRNDDLLGRLGGDEFAVMLFDVDKATAMHVADNYRQLISDFTYHYQGKPVDIGCSIGVALLDESINNKEDLMSRADFACYMAKNRGRNNVYLYHEEDQKDMASFFTDMGWSRRIKYALDNDDFYLVAQPIANLQDGHTQHYEILVRMRDKNGTTAMPKGFLASAERLGMIVDIDKWIIRNAMRLLSLQQNNYPDISYSINLSAMSIGSDSVFEYICDALQEYNIEAQSVIFEVTESVAISNINQAKQFLDSLRYMGFKTALDDFGVGHSSYTYLKDLPIDYLKIDGSFVQNIIDDPLSRAMVKSINEVAHVIGIKTIAEYVYNEAVLEEVKALGIDYAQGFHIGKPEPIKILQMQQKPA